MKLKVSDIPEDGMELRASASEARDKWFEGVVQDAFQDKYPKGNRADLDLHILRTADNVQVTGTAEISLKPACDRCLEPFEKRVAVPLQVNLAPHKDMNFGEGGGEEEGLDEEDVAFSFYKGEEIDLADIIREMLVLDIPFRYLCSESCKGLCPRCGQNWNAAECACPKTSADPRFAVLKNFKSP